MKKITLEIKRKDNSVCYLNGEQETLSFKNPTELTNYFMKEFSAWFSYNKLFWEINAKEWFDRKIGFSDDNTLYYFGGEFSIKLLKEKDDR
jgi:hypothetical protein